jgi:hypothetical protein
MKKKTKQGEPKPVEKGYIKKTSTIGKEGSSTAFISWTQTVSILFVNITSTGDRRVHCIVVDCTTRPVDTRVSSEKAAKNRQAPRGGRSEAGDVCQENHSHGCTECSI